MTSITPGKNYSFNRYMPDWAITYLYLMPKLKTHTHTLTNHIHLLVTYCQKLTLVLALTL